MRDTFSARHWCWSKATAGVSGSPATSAVPEPPSSGIRRSCRRSICSSPSHETHADAVAHLASVVTQTTARGGRVLIPAFAVGRTQEIVYALSHELDEQRIPDSAVFVDSPMAFDATAIFRRHPECFDDETRARLRGRDPFGFKSLRYVRTAEDSKALIARDDPCVVIATSGMAEGGRILQHLQRFVTDPRATMLFVGYQAEHTLGRRILDGAAEVRIFGETYKVGLQVERADAFSAHADRNELLAWAMPARCPYTGSRHRCRSSGRRRRCRRRVPSCGQKRLPASTRLRPAPPSAFASRPR
jgi:metallo-beta-lactamase family protein